MMAATDAHGTPAQRIAAHRRAAFHQRVEEFSRCVDEAHLAEPHSSMHERRVWFVFDLMVSGSFVTGRTSRELASAWGLSRSYLRSVSGEASLLLRTFYALFEDEREWLLLRTRMQFEKMSADAAAMAGTHGPYALQVAGECLANCAFYSGLGPSDADSNYGQHRYHDAGTRRNARNARTRKW